MGIVIKPVKDSAWLPGYQRVAAEITYGLWQKDRLFFDVPEWCAHEAGNPGNSWLLALLPLAFRTGKRLTVGAPVDPVLLRNAGEIMQVWSRWYPALKPVPIETDGTTQEGRSGSRTGLLFTGGVDSFFSALHYDETGRLGSPPATPPVDDLLFVWGFDIPLKRRAEFERKQRRLVAAARELGKHPITLVTNLRETRLRKLDWGLYLHGAALGAAGLLLGNRFDQMLISSSFGNESLMPWGSHQQVDPLMSTRQTAIIHYGAEFGRFAKTAFISKSATALRYLHVCWQDGTDQNCGKCEKCYRTLLALELLGLRGKATSFPPMEFSLQHLKTVWKRNKLIVIWYQEMREAALKRARPDVVRAIDECLALSNDPKPAGGKRG